MQEVAGTLAMGEVGAAEELDLGVVGEAALSVLPACWLLGGREVNDDLAAENREDFGALAQDPYLE